MASYDVGQKPGETLEQYYRRLAKTADQRLVRLERYGEDEFYKTARQWAYARAVQDVKKWRQPGEALHVFRFNTKPPKDPEDLLAKINDIKTFLTAPTSTKQGITDVYKRRADTINKKYGTKFKWQELAKFYTSGQAELWEAKFGSKTALKTIGVLQHNKDKILRGINTAGGKDIRTDNKMLQKTVNKALADNDLNIKDLF